MLPAPDYEARVGMLVFDDHPVSSAAHDFAAQLFGGRRLSQRGRDCDNAHDENRQRRSRMPPKIWTLRTTARPPERSEACRCQGWMRLISRECVAARRFSYGVRAFGGSMIDVDRAGQKLRR